uniref:8 kDa Amblyomma family member n=1 Tax=Rhipicephalus zambeziensis TaxID=60191 RepID=A0A224YAQ7_9ACAR
MTKFNALVLIFLAATFTLISVASSRTSTCFGTCSHSSMACPTGCTCRATKTSGRTREGSCQSTGRAKSRSPSRSRRHRRA